MNRTINFRVASSCHWLSMPRVRYAVLACYLLVLFFLSLNPWVRPVFRDDIFSPDKLEHALAYGGLAILVFFCLNKWRNGSIRSTTRGWISAVLFSALIGVFVEIAQSLFTHNRTGSVEDAVANAFGAGLGCVAYLSVQSIRARWL